MSSFEIETIFLSRFDMIEHCIIRKYIFLCYLNFVFNVVFVL